MSELLQTRRLKRHYGEQTAVRDVSFSLDRGQVLGFLGPNGAGKSTCLRMLTGNLRPHAGEVLINGIDLWDSPPPAKRLIGYLPEIPPLYPDLRVDEYLHYCARLRALPRRRIPSAIDQAKQRCGLASVGRKLIGTLSKGYRQRLGIAQAILHQPALIVLDEPTVGLDPAQMRDIRLLIRELGESHAVLLSTHLLAEVQAVCNRVLILHEGRLVHRAAVPGGAARALILGLSGGADAAALGRLPGVRGVERLGEGRFRLRIDETAEATEIARHAVHAGWGLRELTADRPDLEQTFLRLTSGASAS